MALNHGWSVAPPVTVKADVVDGWLDVHLPPDMYKLVASLTTVDGATCNDLVTVTVN